MPKRGRKEVVVVIDTNVFISYLLGSDTIRRVVRGVLSSDTYTPALSADLIGEFRRVVGKPKIKKRVGEFAPALFIRELLFYAKQVTPLSEIAVCDDPDDNRILECAREAKADFIITGDDDLLRLSVFEKTTILSPADFLQRILKKM